MNCESAQIGALWLDELGRLTSHVLHDLRNGLQGVAVNLEVIRSRADAGKFTTDQLMPFASNAVREFEMISQRFEALAALARAEPGEPDVGSTLETLAALLRGYGKAPLRVERSEVPAQTAISHAALRFILSRAIMPAIRAGATVQCRVAARVPTTVQLQFAEREVNGPDEEVKQVAEELHVVMDMDGNELALTFPTKLRSDTVLA